jgi:hypothetical protein
MQSERKTKRSGAMFINRQLLYSAFALLLAPDFAIAGQHNEEVDDFDGSVNRTYVATLDEANREKTIFVIRDYDRKTGTVFLIVSPTSGLSTSCDKHYLRLKTADGVIHDIDAEERKLKICLATIPAAWIKDEFTVRIPMHSGGAVTANFDTSSLELERIAKD